MKSDKLKFLEKDVDYWECQLMAYPTDMTRDSLERAKKKLKDYTVGDKLLSIDLKRDRAIQFTAGKETYRLYVYDDGSFMVVPRDHREILKYEAHISGLDVGVKISMENSDE